MRKNVFYLLMADLIWGAAFVAQRTGGDVVGAYTFNCIRNLMGALVLLPLIFYYGRSRKTETTASLESTKKHASKKLWIGGLICGTALCFASNFQQLGISMGVSVGKAGFLTACYILLVPIFGLFLGKRTHWNLLLGVGLAVVGLYFLCMAGGDFVLQKADLLEMLCAVGFAIQIIAIDHFAPQVDTVKLSAVEFLVCGIESAIPMLFGELLPNPLGWAQSLATQDAWIPLLYTGICSSGIAYTLQIAGQKNFNPTLASLIMSLESVFSVGFGWLLLGERLSQNEAIGCVAIFAAVMIAQLQFKPRALTEQPE